MSSAVPRARGKSILLWPSPCLFGKGFFFFLAFRFLATTIQSWDGDAILSRPLSPATTTTYPRRIHPPSRPPRYDHTRRPSSPPSALSHHHRHHPHHHDHHPHHLTTNHKPQPSLQRIRHHASPLPPLPKPPKPPRPPSPAPRLPPPHHHLHHRRPLHHIHHRRPLHHIRPQL